MTDDRPVIAARTAEELSDRVPVVSSTPTRAQFRHRRAVRSARRSRRTGVIVVVLGVALVVFGALSWWSVSSSDPMQPTTGSRPGVTTTVAPPTSSPAHA